jgi:hypothetical protein
VSAELHTEQKRTKELTAWIDDHVGDIAIPSGDRFRISGACFHQVVEHCFAIEYLMGKFTGSAFALLRSAYEGLIRGLWLLHCAEERQLSDFIADKAELPWLASLVESVEKKHPSFGAGYLSNIKKEAWSAMCSFAHTGGLQVIRRIKAGEISPDYSDGECIEVLRATRVFALLAAMEISAIASREDLCREVVGLLAKE